MSGRGLGISVVTYKPDLEQFAAALQSLDAAVAALHAQTRTRATLSIVDNGGDELALEALVRQLALALPITIRATGENLGYGRAHNLAMANSTADYHLIMNPDVLLEEQALVQGLAFLEANQAVVALSPEAQDGSGNKLYLCKNYPALLDLALRGFAPAFIRNRYAARLQHYENRTVTDKEATADVELISGCFMLCRTAALQQSGGFNPAFFLYFEDFALSIELGKLGSLVYFPACRIAHFGGDAGRKGLKHIAYFVASALKFYRLYGWKLT